MTCEGCDAFNLRQISSGKLTSKQVDYLFELAGAVVAGGEDLELIRIGAELLQRREGLSVDGKVGPSTRAAIDLALAGEDIGPDLQCFPLLWLPGMVPTDVDGDFADRNARGKICPGIDREAAAAGELRASERPFSFGGGFLAARGGGLHHAEDLMCPEGAIVRAPFDGEVLETIVVTVKKKDGTRERQRRPGAGWSEKGGHHAYIRSARGWRLYLAHNRDALSCKPGDEVLAREQLGFAGRTGNAVRRVRTKDGVVLRGCVHCHISLAAPTPAIARRFCEPRGIRHAGTKVDITPLLRPFLDAGDWARP